LAEPRLVRRLVQRLLEPARNLAPEGFGSQLDLALHPLPVLPPGRDAKRRSYHPPSSRSRLDSSARWCRKAAVLQGFSDLHTVVHRCGQLVPNAPRTSPVAAATGATGACGERMAQLLVYTGSAPGGAGP